MRTTKHPTDLSDAEADAIVAEFDAADDHTVIGEFRGVSASRRVVAAVRQRRPHPVARCRSQRS